MLLSPRSVPDRVRARNRVCNDAGVVYRAEAGRNLSKPMKAADTALLHPGGGGRRAKNIRISSGCNS